ncbi:sodium-dependent transporter [Solibaculum mannosilyticum]|uniref:Transporter n=1 Tax=Solibaculum mannosilyticum TaxID=2780922 RepID=A0A7I8D6A3_9FIRM|nr:sodium-dependent transporter [Solibaculum mannosilyticum]BCI61262.1 transporter [Solibaculum mannosilyticum]
MAKRDQWGSKLGFIFAAIGSAVGLGNIWRFPYVVYKNGGGAFLIPYFVAIFTAGIPLMILEYAMGHKYRGSTPAAMARAKGSKLWEFLGWWPTFTAGFILCYYSVIIAWSARYLTFAFDKSWGSNPNTFFTEDFLRVSSGPFDLGGFRWDILLFMALIWLVNWFVCYRGVSKGIEKFSKVIIPTLFVILVIVAIRGITLPGATDGLNKLFTPDWSRLGDISVWTAAYSQVFFTLSLAMGIMMTYASYLPKKTDIVNTAFVTGLANSSNEILCSIAVFSILGFMSNSQGIPIDQISKDGGIGLAFVAFPQGINLMGDGFSNILGVLLFSCLIFAGLTSSISLLEAFSAPFTDKFKISRKKIVTVVSIVGFIVSSVFATGAGMYILDIVDEFINNYSILVVGLLEAILIGWILKTKVIQEHVNPISYYRAGKWWSISIRFIIPVMLGVMLCMKISQHLTSGYGGYESSALITIGLGIVCVILILAAVTAKLKWRANSPYAGKDKSGE